MYAVIKTGGKQYRVEHGQTLRVETLPVEPGQAISLDIVLAMGLGDAILIGTPVLEGASVQATVVNHGRGDKIRIFKHRRRKHFAKTQGHRQNYTELSITGFTRPDGTTV